MDEDLISNNSMNAYSLGITYTYWVILNMGYTYKISTFEHFGLFESKTKLNEKLNDWGIQLSLPFSALFKQHRFFDQNDVQLTLGYVTMNRGASNNFGYYNTDYHIRESKLAYAISYIRKLGSDELLQLDFSVESMSRTHNFFGSDSLFSNLFLFHNVNYALRIEFFNFLTTSLGTLDDPLRDNTMTSGVSLKSNGFIHFFYPNGSPNCSTI